MEPKTERKEELISVLVFSVCARWIRNRQLSVNLLAITTLKCDNMFMCCFCCLHGLVQAADKFILFSNLIFNTDCPHCHLQAIRLDLLHPDIMTLY